MNLFIIDDFGLLGEQFRSHHKRKAMNKERTIRKLTQLKIEEPGIVAKVKLPAPEAARLDELGLHVGSSVRVLSGALNESILIAVGDSRIGVNFDVAQKIYVY